MFLSIRELFLTNFTYDFYTLFSMEITLYFLLPGWSGPLQFCCFFGLNVLPLQNKFCTAINPFQTIYYFVHCHLHCRSHQLEILFSQTILLLLGRFSLLHSLDVLLLHQLFFIFISITCFFSFPLKKFSLVYF